MRQDSPMSQEDDANTRALVLFAHGSSRPAWRAPLDTLCAQVQQTVPLPLRLAFLERCSPGLHDVVDELAALGVTEVEILPMFISGGGHVDRDVPPLIAEAEARHPTLTFRLLPAIGAHPALVAAITSIAIERV
ncbi:MAG: CbiX/SirB N-terminal domain-containing protein [Myxococcales bacterium]|nr:CbiX/SirB N-terminal domain-containing protein [Myxococcales bacterium]